MSNEIKVIIMLALATFVPALISGALGGTLTANMGLSVAATLTLLVTLFICTAAMLAVVITAAKLFGGKE